MRIKNGGDGIVFRLDSAAESFYPQTAPVFEYYVSMPMLSFQNIDDMVRDYKWLKNRSEFPFYSIIVVDKNKYAETIKEKLGNDPMVSVLINPDINKYSIP